MGFVAAARTGWVGAKRRASCGRTRPKVGCEVEAAESTEAKRLVEEAESTEAKRLVEEWKASEDEDVAWLPQTIEYALQCAQTACAFGLMDSQLRLVVDLPLGRRRMDGLKWASLDESLYESTVLAPHFCEAFRGMRIRLVLATKPVPEYVPWIDAVDTLDKAATTPSGGAFDVVVIASAKTADAAKIDRLIADCPADTAVVLFNCFLDADLGEHSAAAGFTPCYVCRRYDGGAVLLRGHERKWDGFAELSIFEYEHVVQLPPDWRPSVTALRGALQAEGLSFDPLTRYYRSDRALKSAGFWPFMIISSPEVLPLDPAKFEMPQPRKKLFGFLF